MRSQLLDDVRRFIRRERMLEPREPLHVAVSGGIDGMVLLHVLRRLGHPCSVLHVDHGLRGAESNADRAFVESHCRENGIPFQWRKVDVAAHVATKRISVQMAARELRYAVFHAAASKDNRRVAMAHHADDAIETLLMHMLRGTGAQGWSSIKPKSGAMVRPLLAVGRDAIHAYARQHGILYREDSSNADTKYLRNRIRHELVPMLERLRPGARHSLARSVTMLRELTKAADARIDGMLAGRSSGVVPISVIEAAESPQLLLHELLAGHGFHPDTIDRLHDAILERSTGSEFIAGGCRVVVDRDAVIIGQHLPVAGAFTIDLHVPCGICAGFQWSLHEGEELSIPSGMQEVVLDADRLEFPVEVRPWRPGDRLRPIGLGGSKLVSDILIDAKVPLNEKDRTHVLVSGSGEIAWLVGHRIGEGFQAVQSSARVLRVSAP